MARKTELNVRLWNAASECDVHGVTSALAAGADPNFRLRGRYTPLAMAVSAGNRRTTTFKGNRMITIEHDPTETVRILLDAGADPARGDRSGYTPIHTAVLRPAILAMLLPHCRSVDGRMDEGKTALMIAASFGETESIRLLLDHGASINLVSDIGRTALDEAERHPQAIALLKSHGAVSGSDLPEGRLAATKARERERRRAKRSDRVAAKWPRPDLREAADTQGFAFARQRLRALCNGSEPHTHPDYPGFVSYPVTTRKAAIEIVERHRQEFLDLGCFLFASGQALHWNERDSVAILPTTDPYQVISFMGTNRNNGAGPGDVCEGLKRIEAERSFVLDRVLGDRLEGQWTSPLGDAKRFARMLYNFCPDLVDQGVETLAALEREVKRSDRLYFWWD